MRKQAALLSCVMLALALSLVPATSRATVLIQKDLEDLVLESSDIVVGRVLELNSAWNPEETRIYTHVVLEVERAVKGDFRQGERVKFQTIGGRVGEITLQVPSSPRFGEGERVVVFFGGEPNHNTPVTGWEQGKYTVENDIILENGRYLDDFIGEVRAIMGPAKR